MSGRKKNGGRKDHYVPQGYLRGFIAPDQLGEEKPLWHLDLSTREWSRKSSSEIAWERGFYDRAGQPTDVADADVTFARFEREFPLVREKLISRKYKDWVRSRAFLLSYMQMMRARSPLFFKQQGAEFGAMRGATVTGVDGNKITVDSLELRPLSPAFIQNGVISKMTEEISKGPDWFSEFSWCLRYTDDPSNSFIASAQTVVISGPDPTLLSALQNRETLIFFPICWRACLVGALDRFDKGTDIAHPELLRIVRNVFLQPQNGYVVSPMAFEPNYSPLQPVP